MISPHRRIELLLLEEATGRLSDEERHELEALLLEYPNIDRCAYKRTAAIVFLAGAANSAEAMPAGLYSRLLTESEKTFDDAEER